MRTAVRLSLAVGFLCFLAVAVVMAATQNYLAKYGAGGTLVDSAVYESSGNVGIGTSAPAYRLDIVATDYQAARVASSHSAGAVAFLQGQAAGGKTYYFQSSASGSSHGSGKLVIGEWGAADPTIVLNSGNVGLGTGSPSYRLDAHGSDYQVARLLSSHSAGAMLYLTAAATGGSSHYFYSTANGSSHGSDRLLIGEAGNDPMMVLQNGSVGIGTTTPTSKLHVAGDIKVDGNIAAKYQDVAEWVPSREHLEPGSVVVLGDVSSEVLTSTTAYDESVAGVISPRPGVVLGERGPGKSLVAHSGRVRVKVDATFGAIERGDVLVSSPTRGHAMKSQPIEVGAAKLHRPGTILGKAIEPLASGRGEILVLLTLQ
jgi:hypothetical protein